MALLGEIFIFKCQYFSVYSVPIDRLQSTIDRLWICANVSAANFRELSGNGDGVKETFSSVASATRVQWRMSWPGHKHTHTWGVNWFLTPSLKKGNESLGWCILCCQGWAMPMLTLSSLRGTCWPSWHHWPFSVAAFWWDKGGGLVELYARPIRHLHPLCRCAYLARPQHLHHHHPQGHHQRVHYQHSS